MYDKEDVEAVAKVPYSHYSDKLADNKNILLLMGHGNPDKTITQIRNTRKQKRAMQALAANKNVFVGTVDYGDMLFWPEEART